jgi:hypothetical protein
MTELPLAFLWNSRDPISEGIIFGKHGSSLVQRPLFQVADQRDEKN